MQGTQTRRTGRFGFTLIEMLVVIAIIAVLVGLTTAAVMKFLLKGPEVQNMNDLRQLEAAVATFKQDFKLGAGAFFPSRLMLCENYNSYLSKPKVYKNQLAADSAQFLLQMFPRISMTTWTTTGIGWAGTKPGGKTYILEGDQCLVFFLGGIPNPSANGNSCLGFSHNASDPSAATANRFGPYFPFQANRLVLLKHTLDQNQFFFSYLDAYGVQPYLYFSSYRKRNGYNPYTMGEQQANSPTVSSSDCQTTAAQPAYMGQLAYPGKGTVWPYHDSTNYLNSDSFQIVSAGLDTKFGPGTDVTAAKPFYWNATTFGGIAKIGMDDQTNFSDGILGAGP